VCERCLVQMNAESMKQLDDPESHKGFENCVWSYSESQGKHSKSGFERVGCVKYKGFHTMDFNAILRSMQGLRTANLSSKSESGEFGWSDTLALDVLKWVFDNLDGMPRGFATIEA